MNLRFSLAICSFLSTLVSSAVPKADFEISAWAPAESISLYYAVTFNFGFYLSSSSANLLSICFSASRSSLSMTYR